MSVPVSNSFSHVLRDSFSSANVKSFGKHMLAHTGTSAIAACIFTSNPLAGLIIGAVSYPTTKAINWICKRADIGENSVIAKTTARVLSAIAGIALGALIAHGIGLKITFIGACIIALSTTALYIVGGVLAIGCIVVGVLAAQAALKALPGDRLVNEQSREAITHFRDTLNDVLHNRIAIDQRISRAITHFRRAVDEGRHYLGLEAPQPVVTV
jgi:hypothetical protein